MAINWFNKCEIVFGKGDVIVRTLCSHCDKTVAVAFGSASKSYPIGTHPSNEEEISFNVGLVFDKVESIDVVMEKLSRSREILTQMLRGKENEQS